jgi:hypothetical protein
VLRIVGAGRDRKRAHFRRVTGEAKQRKALYFSLRCFPRNSVVRFQASLASSGR